MDIPDLSPDRYGAFGIMDPACSLCFSLPSWCLGMNALLLVSLAIPDSLIEFSVFFHIIYFFLFLLLFLPYVYTSPTYLFLSCGSRWHQSLETLPGYFLNTRTTNKNFTYRFSGTSSHCTFPEHHDLPLQVCFPYIILYLISTDIKLINLARSWRVCPNFNLFILTPSYLQTLWLLVPKNHHVYPLLSFFNDMILVYLGKSIFYFLFYFHHHLSPYTLFHLRTPSPNPHTNVHVNEFFPPTIHWLSTQ